MIKFVYAIRNRGNGKLLAYGNPKKRLWQSKKWRDNAMFDLECENAIKVNKLDFEPVTFELIEKTNK